MIININYNSQIPYTRNTHTHKYDKNTYIKPKPITILKNI